MIPSCSDLSRPVNILWYFPRKPMEAWFPDNAIIPRERATQCARRTMLANLHDPNVRHLRANFCRSMSSRPFVLRGKCYCGHGLAVNLPTTFSGSYIPLLRPSTAGEQHPFAVWGKACNRHMPLGNAPSKRVIIKPPQPCSALGNGNELESIGGELSGPHRTFMVESG